jgi:peroxiredoxin
MAAPTGTQPRAAPLAPATEAPDFELPSTPDQKLSLSGLRGRPVVLVFYPEDWSPVCSDQLALYQELQPEFARYDAQLVGISVDGIWCHLAFAQDRHLRFPLLADFEPKGEVSRLYGVYREGDGTSERALYVIDRDGVIRWSYVSPVGINPGADGILQALEELQS